MQAVAAEPAVALEALPPATFDCIGLHHHKEEQEGKILWLKKIFSSITRRSKEEKHLKNVFSSTKGRSREENRRKNIFH